MLVKDFIKQYKGTKFYFIPNILSNQKFTEPYHHYGHEVISVNSINKEILNSEVVKYWFEDKDKKELNVIWRLE